MNKKKTLLFGITSNCFFILIQASCLYLFLHCLFCMSSSPAVLRLCANENLLVGHVLSVLVSINSCSRLLIYPSLLKTDILLSGNPQTVCTPVYLLPCPSPIISLQNIKVFFFSFYPLLVVFNLLLYISWLSLCFLLSRIFQ